MLIHSTLFIALNGVDVCSMVDLNLERGHRAIANAASNLMPAVQVHVAHEHYPLPPLPSAAPLSVGSCAASCTGWGPSPDDNLEPESGMGNESYG
jgi:hypothetical protein